MLNKKSNQLEIKFLLVLSTAYLAAKLNIQGFLSLMPLIRDEFAITRAQAGLYSSFFFISATLIAIFSGRLVDKIGAKKGLVLGTSFVGILITLHAIALEFYILLILAFFTGLSYSVVTPSLNKAVIKKVAADKRAISMGVMQSGAGLGGFLGASLLPVIATRLDWRLTIFLSGLIAILLGVFIALSYQEDEREINLEQDSNKLSFKESIYKLLQNKALLKVCFVGLAFGMGVGAVPAHYTIYLTQDLNLTLAMAGLALGVMQIGGVIGLPGWGLINDKFLNKDRRQGLILISSLIIIISLIFALYITNFGAALWFILILSFLFGATGLGWLGVYFTAVGELASEETTGLATGFALVFIRFGIFISPPIFGHLADITESYYLSWLTLGLAIFGVMSLFVLTSE